MRHLIDTCDLRDLLNTSSMKFTNVTTVLGCSGVTLGVAFSVCLLQLRGNAA